MDETTPPIVSAPEISAMNPVVETPVATVSPSVDKQLNDLQAMAQPQEVRSEVARLVPEEVHAPAPTSEKLNIVKASATRTLLRSEAFAKAA